VTSTRRPARTGWATRSTLVVLTALLALTGCSGDDPAESGSTSDAPALRRFTVVLDWTPNTNHGGMYLAEAEGWYREAGLDVEFVEPGDSSSLQLLSAGRADVAVSVAEEVLPARAQGLPVTSIASVIGHNTSSLVSLAEEGISRPRHLAGKTYGGWGGQLEEALIHELVECDGGDPEAVEFVQVGEADYRIGLERDQYDFVWIFDGWDGVRLTEVDGVDLNRIAFADHTDCIPDWYTPLLASSDDVIADRPDDLRAFLSATARGYEMAMEDPAAAAAALLDVSPDLDAELVEQSATWLSTRFADEPEQWGRQEAAVWDPFAEFLVEAGLLEDGFDPSTAWTDEFLDAG
jgi:ABC-type nitrate/sulfonate/bicarbonate transport system substrate-binding protein